MCKLNTFDRRKTNFICVFIIVDKHNLTVIVKTNNLCNERLRKILRQEHANQISDFKHFALSVLLMIHYTTLRNMCKLFLSNEIIVIEIRFRPQSKFCQHSR